MSPENLRDKDLAILQAIQNGASNTSEIKEATTLSRREINYSINEKSLEELDLVQVHRREGLEWKEINGHQKKIWKPKKLELTDQGIQILAEHGTDKQYQDMTQEELIQTIHELETRLDRLEVVFKDFRSKVMEKI